MTDQSSRAKEVHKVLDSRIITPYLVITRYCRTCGDDPTGLELGAVPSVIRRVS
jgi:hypothetical protein